MHKKSIEQYATQLEKKIIALHEQIADAKQTIDHLKIMAANISHDLQTPMAGANFMFDEIFQSNASIILTLTQLIEQQLQDCIEYTKTGRRFVSIAAGSMSMHLEHIKNDRIDPKTFTICSINTVIEEALTTFFFSNDQQKQLIHWPKGAVEDFKFKGDPVLSQHIIWNLLKNALQAIDKAGKGNITIRLSSNDTTNSLYFTDTATGMPPEVATHIFEQFYTKSGKGSGLGLPFVKAVMRAYGGDITCDTKEREYTEFTLQFPKIAKANLN